MPTPAGNRWPVGVSAYPDDAMPAWLDAVVSLATLAVAVAIAIHVGIL